MSTNPTPPGGIYLCQINDSFSCGACCGLYNVVTPTQSYLSEILAARTERFSKISHDLDTVEKFRAETLKREKPRPPFKDFHHCPYIGFIDEKHKMVGCLLHPQGKGNNGIDLRGLSEYGGWACRTYFCPSYHKLPDRWKKIILMLSKDWYTYGAVITEYNLWQAFMQLTEERIQQPLNETVVANNISIRAATEDFFNLKWQWPFRSRHFPESTHYFFKTPEAYHRPKVNVHSRLNVSSSESLHPAYELIFRELISEFQTEKDIIDAVQLIDDIINRIHTGLRNNKTSSIKEKRISRIR